MMNILNHRLRLTLSDGRVFTGQMLAFDKFMNLVLAECEEFRQIRSKTKVTNDQTKTQIRELKRILGLVILRGDSIVSMSIDGPPPVSVESVTEKARMAMSSGPGLARPANRMVQPMQNATGLANAPVLNPMAQQPPMGLGGPVRGIGGPMGSMMQGRPMPPPPGGQFPGMGAPVGANPFNRPPPPGFRPPMPGMRPQPGQFGAPPPPPGAGYPPYMGARPPTNPPQ
ncbi:Small nuclear ribonucleoprotein-associated protein B [Smittium mucronatum]|uniref:Sm protein B n=1 Tax=Smittium mucronatum TaxID=133383 RepID=A0A1R0H5P1_9FUNG|nr:Small nuclear ribonucleoprotein-associated protein B [Smittium mucronatum]